MTRSETRTNTSTRTGTRTRVRPHWMRPDGSAWLDMGATIALTLVAISGLGATFTGHSYLVVAAVGVVLAVVLTHISRSAGWPLVAPVVGALAVFYLLGGPLTLRSLGDWAMIPGAHTLTRLTDEVVFGWKDMLTTLPPVDGQGPLLVLPWALSLTAGVVTFALARQPVRLPWLEALLPVLGQVLLLAGVILLGVSEPGSLLLQGSVFAALALAWLAVRSQRATASVRGGEATWGRAVAGAALIGIAAAAALPLSGSLVGDDERVIARSWIEPPFDIGRYTSRR